MVSEARVESQKKWSSHEIELLASEKNVYSIDEAGKWSTQTKALSDKKSDKQEARIEGTDKSTLKSPPITKWSKVIESINPSISPNN